MKTRTNEARKMATEETTREVITRCIVVKNVAEMEKLTGLNNVFRTISGQWGVKLAQRTDDFDNAVQELQCFFSEEVLIDGDNQPQNHFTGQRIPKEMLDESGLRIGTGSKILWVNGLKRQTEDRSTDPDGIETTITSVILCEPCEATHVLVRASDADKHADYGDFVCAEELMVFDGWTQLKADAWILMPVGFRGACLSVVDEEYLMAKTNEENTEAMKHAILKMFQESGQHYKEEAQTRYEKWCNEQADLAEEHEVAQENRSKMLGKLQEIEHMLGEIYALGVAKDLRLSGTTPAWVFAYVGVGYEYCFKMRNTHYFYTEENVKKVHGEVSQLLEQAQKLAEEKQLKVAKGMCYRLVEKVHASMETYDKNVEAYTTVTPAVFSDIAVRIAGENYVTFVYDPVPDDGQCVVYDRYDLRSAADMERFQRDLLECYDQNKTAECAFADVARNVKTLVVNGFGWLKWKIR